VVKRLKAESGLDAPVATNGADVASKRKRRRGKPKQHT
jgi:hypothetical protein